MTNKRSKPNPDDRSDNVEKLQKMIHNTLENVEAAEETLDFSEGDSREQIISKNKRRKQAIEGFRDEIKDESQNKN